jgi:hypothetical protein
MPIAPHRASRPRTGLAAAPEPGNEAPEGTSVAKDP